MCRLMIVDDDKNMIEILEVIFGQDYDVVSARSIAEAKKYLVEKPEIVLIDYYLQDGTGETLIKDGATGDASCVLITAIDLSAEKKAEMLDMGFLYVVQKPFNTRELTAIINRSYQHWQTKTEMTKCIQERPVYRPESMKRFNDAVLSFRSVLSSAKLVI